VEVIREATEGQQIDPKSTSQSPQLFFNPDFPVIEILPGHRIIAQQKTPAHDPADHMHHRHFVWGEHLRPSQPRHDKPPRQTANPCP
jgi:hypothetical protein